MRYLLARSGWCFCLFALLALLPLAISRGQDSANSEPAATAASNLSPPAVSEAKARGTRGGRAAPITHRRSRKLGQIRCG